MRRNELPCMAHADDVPYVAQAELQQLVCHDARGITESEQTVICEDGLKTHSPCVQEAFMAQVAERCVAMDDLNLFPDEDVPKNWKGREHCGKGRRSIYDPVGDVINLETVGQVSHSSSTRVWRAIGMGNDDYPMASIDQFLISESACSTEIPGVLDHPVRNEAINTYAGNVIDVALDTSWLWIEEIRYHPVLDQRWFNHKAGCQGLDMQAQVCFWS